MKGEGGNTGQVNDATDGRSGRVYNTHDRRICPVFRMKSRELIRVLERGGWRLAAVKGSHHQFKHPVKPGRVTVPHPRRDLPAGTLNSVLKQAGLKPLKPSGN
jgi:predicted RNA binding protein YcfA (HicA-like mRNA interferase family)